MTPRKYPLLRAIASLISAVFYVVVWRREKRKKPNAKIVDVTGTVIENKE